MRGSLAPLVFEWPMSELSFLREDKKIFKKNRSRLKYIQLEIAIIKNEILNLKIFELEKFWTKFLAEKIEKVFLQIKTWKSEIEENENGSFSTTLVIKWTSKGNFDRTGHFKS